MVNRVERSDAKMLKLPPGVGQIEDEWVYAQWRAFRTQNSRRLVRGRLYLTNVRLVFWPAPYSAVVFGGQYWLACHTQVTDVGCQSRDASQIFGGSFRDRLRINLDDRSVEKFIVPNLDATIAQIRDVISDSRFI